MRIRKRAVPFPLSSLLPVPISDPLFNLNGPPPVPAVVQLQHGGGPSAVAASDRPIGRGSSIVYGSDGGEKEKKSEDCCSEILSKKNIEDEKAKDIKNYGAQQESFLKPSPSSTLSSQQVPAKKRSRRSGFVEEEDEEKKKKKKNTKKRASLGGRGGALAEGSRCSRVNGRGWRCCQQTLVGYSLCEHHLGKGRLRTMTSVRTRSLSSSSSSGQNTAPVAATVSHPTEPPQAEGGDGLANINNDGDGDYDYDDDDDDNDKKKRVKLGMVKARSISSLLGQMSSNTTATAATVATSSVTTGDHLENHYI